LPVKLSAPNPAKVDSWTDTRLVEECLNGNDAAWTALIERYKNLIYSLPVRQGFSQPDASDIFQSVVAQLLSELGRLREPRALPRWLIQVTSHKCIQRRREQMREMGSVMHDGATVDPCGETPTPEALILDATREQILRRALDGASPRCRDLIRMLFFEDTARPYAEIAASLGIATGSIGFIRRRCLEHLRRYLEDAGFTS
jgi:RNA polymerase sigma factor (sigma-70 family)